MSVNFFVLSLFWEVNLVQNKVPRTKFHWIMIRDNFVCHGWPGKSDTIKLFTLSRSQLTPTSKPWLFVLPPDGYKGDVGGNLSSSNLYFHTDWPTVVYYKWINWPPRWCFHYIRIKKDESQGKNVRENWLRRGVTRRELKKRGRGKLSRRQIDGNSNPHSRGFG
jgi:hypothetical protein